MGVFNNMTIPASVNNPTERANRIVNYLNLLDGITAEVHTITVDSVDFIGAKFTVDEINIEAFLGYSSTCQTTAAYIKNNNTDIYLVPNGTRGNTYAAASAMKVGYYFDNNIKIVAVGDTMGTYRLKLELVSAVTPSSSKIVGYCITDIGSEPFVDMSNLTFEDPLSDTRAFYNYANMFPYTALAGTLDYAVGGVFVNGDQYREFRLETMVECSTVPLLSTQSLLIGNYLALGAHCLVPLDEEE